MLLSRRTHEQNTHAPADGPLEPPFCSPPRSQFYSPGICIQDIAFYQNKWRTTTNIHWHSVQVLFVVTTKSQQHHAPHTQTYKDNNTMHHTHKLTQSSRDNQRWDPKFLFCQYEQAGRTPFLQLQTALLPNIEPANVQYTNCECRRPRALGFNLQFGWFLFRDDAMQSRS